MSRAKRTRSTAASCRSWTRGKRRWPPAALVRALDRADGPGLGALYLRPEQKQFVRVNLGLRPPRWLLKEVRLDVLRRSGRQVLKTVTLPATPADIQRQRAKIPDGLRDDFRNLLLADLDVSFLPVQPFDDPQRNWVIRATRSTAAARACGR